MKRFLVAVALLNVFVTYAQKKADGFGKIEFVTTKHNFGNINETAGKVYCTFEFVNVGSAPVKITNIVTGCGCTTADYTKDEVPPGGKGFITAGFDPKGRQGPFDKLITIESTGSTRAQTVSIAGNVIPAKNNFSNYYQYRYGNIAINDQNIVFKKIYHDGYDSTLLYLYNVGNKRIDFYHTEAPSNIILDEKSFSIMPGYEKFLKIKYYPFQPVEYGTVTQKIKFFTTDDTLAHKVFTVKATIVENFGKLDAKALKKAPKAEFSTREHDFGNVSFFQSPETTIFITNKGKSDLIIRKITRSCTCLTIEPESTIIKPGKKMPVKIKMGLANMAGPDTKNVKFLLNDPENTEVQVDLKINVTP
ncbi:MAG: DUF1573 domain-containing protein [Bacteroidia bacterium]